MTDTTKFSNAFTDYFANASTRLSKTEKQLLPVMNRDGSMKEYIHDEAYNWILSLIVSKTERKLSDIYRVSLSKLVDICVIEESKEEFYYALDQMNQFQMTTGWYRRSVRSESYAPFVRASVLLLWAYARLRFYKAELSEVLTGKVDPKIYQNARKSDWHYAGMLAAQIDRGNEKTIQAVQDILLGENNTTMISHELIRGIVMCKDQNMYQLLGDFLLAARLQEGARQAVCESMDAGRTEAFLYLLKVIEDHDLIRYSSVKRAVSTWIGIYDPKSVERIADKLVHLMGKCLREPKFCEEQLGTEDAIAICCALWAKGFYDAMEARNTVFFLAETGTRNQMMVASYFVESLQSKNLQMSVAKKVIFTYPEDLELAACYMPYFIRNVYGRFEELLDYRSGYARYYYSVKDDKGSPPKQMTYNIYFASEEEAKTAYQILKGILEKLPKNGIDLNPCIFPWYRVMLSQSEVAARLCLIAWMLQEEAYLEEAVGWLPLIEADFRHLLIRVLLFRPKTELQRHMLLEFLHGQGENTMAVAFRILQRLKLKPEDYLKIEQNLKYKKGRIRTLELLKRQESEALLACVERLLKDKTEECHMGALELAQYIKENRQDDYQALIPMLHAFSNPSPKEQILLTKLIEEKDKTEDIFKTPGYGLYAPQTKWVIPPITVDLTQAEYLFTFGEDVCIQVLEKLDAYIEKHKDLEYQDRFGNEQVLGNQLFACSYGETRLEIYPFRELWESFYEKKIQSPELLMEIYLYQCCLYKQHDYESNINIYQKVFGTPIKEKPPFKKLVQGQRYSAQIKIIIELLFKQYVPKKLKAYWGLSGIAKLFHVLEPEVQAHMAESKSKPWRNENQILSRHILLPIFADMYGWLSDVEDKDWGSAFSLCYQVGAGISDYMRCYVLGLWNKDMIYKAILKDGKLENCIDVISAVAQDDVIPVREINWMRMQTFFGKNRIPQINGQYRLDRLKDAPDVALARELYHELMPIILKVELKRGEQMTPFSKYISQIHVVYGVDVLVQILIALGKDTLDRGYCWYPSGEDKRETLCYLLKICHPKRGETVEDLRIALKGTKITKKRLVEVAMYAKQWIPMMEEYLNLTGFASGCYYFIAHTSEVIEDTTMAVIAKYTPLSKEELCKGAFDIHWFFEAYEKLGEENFKMLYDAAKYSSVATAHARARKYADAALGKVTIEQLTAKIKEKRNKDLLMSLPLLPLDSDREKRETQLLERYEFIQKFKKESQQFGAQRRSSEACAVELALENLSVNAGFTDVMRLILRMESRLTEEYETYFAWTPVEDVEIRIDVDETGKSSLKCRKDQKELKAIPAKYKKLELVVLYKEANKKLKEQYRRAKQMLERAMEDRTAFEVWELRKLQKNVVLCPMIKPLVFRTTDMNIDPNTETEQTPIKMGFLTDGGLVDWSGSEVALMPEAQVWIAHPYDFYQNKCWHEYQKALFDRQIKQPFKQIFRELYVKLTEELQKKESLLFSGNQIQPQKTIATLRSRRWVADYESGLQKIYYKENIIATIYAVADWFSPSDVEAPTLESVVFYDRKTFQELTIQEIPDIVYSEVMRDVDLAVSVAHAGGVDPEASHSTIEMRRVIVENNLKLFQISNVRLEGTHAHIEGKLGQYTVHLGSGVIHQAGNAMLYVVPVHSQYRGRIFLPFVDEDPKTAEILSKILLFAEDTKIKDPGIISQIR